MSSGRAFLGNPDLVERIRTGATLRDVDPATFYGGDDTGYIDQPPLEYVAQAGTAA